MSKISMPPPRIGRVALSVGDLERSVKFYQDVIGLTVLEHEGEMAILGAGDEGFLQLHGQPGARPVQRATGLYHFAILVPSRLDLARTLYHLLQDDAPISGFADHHVSEAVYLTDPDGHGIEIYRDRPREEWPYHNGQLGMGTDPIDMQGILNELVGQPDLPPRMVPGTFVGHIHLQVANIAATEKFYAGPLGMDRVLRYGARATFLSYDGYHHHLGGNTWAGENLALAPDDAARLLWYEIVQPDETTVNALAGQLNEAGHEIERGDGAFWVVDPSGIRVLLSAGG